MVNRNTQICAGVGLGGPTIAHRAGSRRLGFFDFSRHGLFPLAGAPSAIWGQAEPNSQWEKNSLGGLGVRKFSEGGARADPNRRRWS
jgi:hypothetical protein